MKSLPRLRLEPRPTRPGAARITAASAASTLLVLMLPLPSWAAIGCLSAIAAILADGLLRCIGRRVPAILNVGIDRRIVVTDRTGRTLAGRILDASYVGAWLTTIVWCADAQPWWRPARAILVLPDTLPPNAFRQLRLRLRYGRAPAADETSGEVAG